MLYTILMNGEQLDDLKQFFATTVSQATAARATKDDLQNAIHELSTRMDGRFDETLAAIAETVPYGQ